jgi:hypothetical protein
MRRVIQQDEYFGALHLTRHYLITRATNIMVLFTLTPGRDFFEDYFLATSDRAGRHLNKRQSREIFVEPGSINISKVQSTVILGFSSG